VDPITMTEDFQWVLDVFDSCETHGQLETAKRLAQCFFIKYRTEFDEHSRTHTMRQFTEAMDDCIYRIS